MQNEAESVSCNWEEEKRQIQLHYAVQLIFLTSLNTT